MFYTIKRIKKAKKDLGLFVDKVNVVTEKSLAIGRDFKKCKLLFTLHRHQSF